MASKLQTAIKKYLAPQCLFVWVTTAGRLPGTKYRLAPKGTPDIVGCTLRGKMFFIEVKEDGDTVKPHQAELIDKLAGFGYLSIIARSLEEVERAFKGVYE